MGVRAGPRITASRNVRLMMSSLNGPATAGRRPLGAWYLRLL